MYTIFFESVFFECILGLFIGILIRAYFDKRKIKTPCYFCRKLNKTKFDHLYTFAYRVGEYYKRKIDKSFEKANNETYPKKVECMKAAIELFGSEDKIPEKIIYFIQCNHMSALDTIDHKRDISNKLLGKFLCEIIESEDNKKNKVFDCESEHHNKFLEKIEKTVDFLKYHESHIDYLLENDIKSQNE